MNITDYSSHSREEIKAIVTEVAMKAFHANGIRSVTMDDIAHQLSMSKRTLYQLFADKEELLMSCMQRRLAEEDARMAKLVAAAPNVLALILQETDRKMQELEEVSPLFFVELSKYPRVMDYMKRRHEAQFQEGVAFLRRGVDQGIFREDIDFGIVYGTFLHLSEYALGMAENKPASPFELFMNTVFLYLRGFTTEKGRSIMDDFMERKRKP